jgi:uncharacterized protein (TIGR02217 family)
MAFWLAAAREGQETDWIQRFDPRFWTVNFPRPMTAAVVTTAPDALRVDATFLREGDLAGLIWESADRFDHPLLAYDTDRDYDRTTLSFRWRSAGVIALDAVHGPTLTIEGRDQNGAARAWYVRLWNYALGTPTDAVVSLPFGALAGGFLHPAEADPVWPRDIDRMFISMVAPGYVPGSEQALATEVEGWIELSGIRCVGQRPVLRIGDVVVPPHGLSAATGYDDNGTQTPARIIRNLVGLGYRGSVVHYVGMSHYFRLESAGGGTYLAGGAGDPLCTPARAWHLAFFAECVTAGYAPIASLSYELLAQHCPTEWQQRAFDGSPALTGWDPPSALLSPANAAAMAWLQTVAGEFVGLMQAAGAAVRFQVGEPWWWVMADGRICLYDNAARTALGGAPVEIPDLREQLTAAQTDLLDAAGALLAESTAALTAVIKALDPNAETLLLAFTPTVLDPATPEARRANLPLGWAAPAFDRLQVEDYDWLTAGADAARRAAYATVNDRLGYPPEEQDYFAGFVLLPEDRELWRRIDAGIDEARRRDAHQVFVWALPQICRDGFVRLPESDLEDSDMESFDDVPYPLALGRDAAVSPEFSTSVAVTASGFERRNSLWADARLRFDVGPGVRSEYELGQLIAFFRARRGAARGFRLRDPSDFSSNGMVGTPGLADQFLGVGDGLSGAFPLVKRYGEGTEPQVRRITRPVQGTVLVSIDGIEQTTGWSLTGLGVVEFAAPPADGAIVRAGYLFDVPVRFAEDRLDTAGAAFAAGEAPSVPVIEVREAT